MMTPDQIAGLIRTIDARVHALRTAERGTPAFQTAANRLLESLNTARLVNRAPMGGEGYFAQLLASKQTATYTYEVLTGQTISANTAGRLVGIFDAQDLRDRIAANLHAFRATPTDANLARLRSAIVNGNYYLLRKPMASNLTETEAGLRIDVAVASEIVAQAENINIEDVINFDPRIEDPNVGPPTTVKAKNYIAAVSLAAFGVALIYIAVLKR